MKPVLLLIVLGISAISSEEIDLNNSVDENISRVGDLIRKQNLKSLELPSYANLNDKYSFPGVILLGYDYLRRTGDCKLIKEQTRWNYKLNFGSSFLVIVVPQLSYNGEEMSAVFRVRNNSIYLSFDQMKGSMNVSVNDLTVSDLGQVEFWSSSPKYDGTNVENVFANAQKFLNGLLDDEKQLWNMVGKEVWSMLIHHYPRGIFNEL